MEQLETEGMHNPEVEIEATAIGLPNLSAIKYRRLVSDAQTAIRVTLDELSLFAGITTADTTAPAIPTPSQSAYSLLLDPAIFKLKGHSSGY